MQCVISMVSCILIFVSIFYQYIHAVYFAVSELFSLKENRSINGFILVLHVVSLLLVYCAGYNTHCFSTGIYKHRLIKYTLHHVEEVYRSCRRCVTSLVSISHAIYISCKRRWRTSTWQNVYRPKSINQHFQQVYVEMSKIGYLNKSEF